MNGPLPPCVRPTYTQAQIEAIEALIVAATGPPDHVDDEPGHVGPLPIAWAPDNEPLHDGVMRRWEIPEPQPEPQPTAAELVERHARFTRWGIEIENDEGDETVKPSETAAPPGAALFSEGAFSRLWSHAHGLDKYLYAKGIGWLVFDSGIWHGGTVAARRDMADLIRDRVQKTKLATRFDNSRTVEGAIKMAQIEPDTTRTVEVSSFDKNPMMIGLPGGRLFNIVTGKARPATPQDRLRKALAIAPASAPSKLWTDFVYESLAHYHTSQRDRVASWVQEFCGAMLTGVCSDQKALFVWGEPGTGKTVFAETLRHVMGSYATIVAGERIAGREGGHRQWIVGLQGRRLILINELPERGHWHAQDLNALIEGSALEGNSMRQNSITFESQASVVIVGNHRPRASAASGIWRRLVQVEFRNKPEKPDPKLLDKLKAEAPGVLAWMFEGASRWQARGHLPDVPDPIKQAVEAYRRESDPFAEYLVERTAKAPGQNVAVNELYADFGSWWKREVDADEKNVPKKRTFGVKLNEAGWAASLSVNGQRVRPGYCLKGTGT